jgi:GntR family transcriptional regulator
MIQDGVDKTNPTPLYYQLQEILREKIECGIWKPGDMIPTENELMVSYGISRSTVRQAILALVNDGYLKREKSKGTIVTSTTSREHVIGSLMSFTSEMNMKGIPHYSVLLSQRVVKADRLLAAKMNLAEGSEVYYLRRVRFVNDRPFLVDEHYIPYYLVPGIEQKYEENTSLYRLLQNDYKFNLHHGQIVFEPINPPSTEVSDLLKITPATSLILAERVVCSETEVTLDYFKAYIHGKFSIDMVSSTEFGQIRQTEG